MSLRIRTFLTLAGVLLALLLLLSSIVYITLSNSFAVLEQQQTHESVEQVLNALNADLQELARTTRDYSAWDDTYAYMASDDRRYLDANYSDETFINNRLHLVVLAGTDGRIHFARTFDLATETELSVPERFLNLTGDDPLLVHASPNAYNTGVVLLSDGPMLVAAQPILTNTFGGPARGTLIMGRRLDADELQRLSDRVQLPLRLYTFSDPTLSTDLAAIMLRAVDSGIQIRVLSDQSIDGYAAFSDISGLPAFVLEIERTREVSRYGQQSIVYTLSSMVLIGLVLILLTTGLLERSVLQRIIRLNNEVEQIRADGDLKRRVAHQGPDEIGRLSGSINTMLDSLEQTPALRAARDAAESASRAKSQFLGNMSHELRTPLTAILGYTELLSMELRRGGHTELLIDTERIQNAGKHLLGLINDVLDLSRIEAGRLPIHYQTVAIERLIRQSIDTVRPALERNRNRIAITLAPDLPELYSDESRLRQILINLLDNAVKFTNDGTIMLHVEQVDQNDAPSICFRVSDTGIGIAQDQLPQLFQEFHQIDASNSRRYGGTGLGLALSRRLARLLGGDISVSSVLGSGSTFCLALPTVPAEILNELRASSTASITGNSAQDTQAFPSDRV